MSQIIINEYGNCDYQCLTEHGTYSFRINFAKLLLQVFVSYCFPVPFVIVQLVLALC